MFKKEIKRPSTSKTPIVQLTADIPINHSYWCFITDSVGWPLIQIFNICVERDNGFEYKNVYELRPLFLYLTSFLGDAFHNARS